MRGSGGRDIRLVCCVASVVLMMMTSCAPRPLIVTGPPGVAAERDAYDTPPRLVQWYADFWRAIGNVNIPVAWTLATTRDQRQFADGLQSMANGNFTEAGSAISPLLHSSDSLVRNAARVTYGALLSAQGQWQRLAEFADSATPDSTVRRGRDAAGVERWAPAFSTAGTRAMFTDSIAILPLLRTSTGVPIVQVRVNGIIKYFWLDTGSSISILSSAIARECGIVISSPDTLELLTAIGRIPARPSITQSLRIGPIEVKNLPSMLVDTTVFSLPGATAPGATVLATRIDGIIGFDIIRQLDVTIDDAHRRVILRKPAMRAIDRHRHPRNLFWFGVPIVTLITERGTTVHFTLDTGAEETYGTRSLVTKTGTRAVQAERRNVNGFGGTIRERGLVISRARLFVDEVSLLFTHVFLYNAQYPTIFELDGTLGSDLGRGGSVRIDATNGMFEVTP